MRPTRLSACVLTGAAVLLAGCAQTPAPLTPDPVSIAHVDFTEAPVWAGERREWKAESRGRIFTNDALVVSVLPPASALGGKSSVHVNVRCVESAAGEGAAAVPLDEIRLSDVRSSQIDFHLDFRGAAVGRYAVDLRYADSDNAESGSLSLPLVVERGPWTDAAFPGASAPGALPTIRYAAGSRKLATVIAGCGANPPVRERRTAWARSLPLRFRGRTGSVHKGTIHVIARKKLVVQAKKSDMEATFPDAKTKISVRKGQEFVDLPLVNVPAGERIRYAVEVTMPTETPPGCYRTAIVLATRDGRFRAVVPFSSWLTEAPKATARMPTEPPPPTH